MRQCPGMDLGLTGKACIVTGSSRGIGLATARTLCEEGANVLLTARGAERLEAARRQCVEAGGNERAVTTLPIDVTVPGAPERIVDACAQRFGGVSVVVNNAGSVEERPLEELTDEDWRSQWEQHVMAPTRLMRAAMPFLLRDGGRVVNVNSSSGKRPGLFNASYSVAKAGQLSLSRTFAEAYASRGVLVNAVIVGPVATPLWLGEGGLADQMSASRQIPREEVLETTRARIPLRRFAEEDEVAGVIAFLCSERSSNVAGAAWAVDGGHVSLIF